MSLDLKQLAEARKALVAALDEALDRVRARQLEARQLVESCEAELQDIAKKRDIVEQAAQIEAEYAGHLTAAVIADTPSDLPPQERKRRARIGPQRYLALHTLRALIAANVEQIAKSSNVDLRRVKDLVRSDAADGILRELSHDDELYEASDPEPQYVLTDDGEDLIRRFEAYKRSKGQPLPTREDANRTVAADDDLELPDQNTEEAEKVSAQEPSASSADRGIFG